MATRPTPCAACRVLRRKCTQDCVFAPHFPPSDPERFICLNKVFGTGNVSKILNDLHPNQRADAVTSLVHEAQASLRDPVYGCVGSIAILQQQLKKVKQDVVTAKKQLAGYIGSGAAISRTSLPFLGNNPPPNLMVPPGVMPQGESLNIRDPNLSQQHQHQLQDEQLQFRPADPQRTPAMILGRGDQQGMFDGYGIDNNGSVTATGFYQMDVNDHGAGGSLSGSSLGLGNFGGAYQMGQETEHRISHDQPQTQLMFPPPLQKGREKTGFNQMNVNDYSAGGSLSGSSLGLGNFGDAYQMGQETERHINHGQLQTQFMLQPPLQEGQEQTEEGQFGMQPKGQENLHDEEEEEELEPPVK